MFEKWSRQKELAGKAASGASFFCKKPPAPDAAVSAVQIGRAIFAGDCRRIVTKNYFFVIFFGFGGGFLGVFSAFRPLVMRVCGKLNFFWKNCIL